MRDFRLSPLARCLVVIAGGSALFAGQPAEKSDVERRLQPQVDRALAERHVEQQLEKLEDAAGSLTLEEIPAALQFADSLGKLREREVWKQAVLKRWGALAPAEAFAATARLPESREKTRTLRAMAIHYTKSDPAQAASRVAQLSPGSARSEALSAVAETWARGDAKEAMTWAAGLPSPADRERAENEIRFVWVHTDPAAAAPRVVASVPHGNMRNALLTNIATEWVLRDPSAAITWAKGLTNPAERDLALARAAESWADVSPKAAGEFALGLAPGTLRDQALAAVAGRWATQSPAAAAAFTAGLEDAARDRAVGAVLETWAAVEPANAEQWVSNLPAGEVRDEAMVHFLQAVAPWDPERGLRLVSKLSPALATCPGAEACARAWLAIDYRAASDFIAGAGLAEDLKARWQSALAAQ